MRKVFIGIPAYSPLAPSVAFALMDLASTLTARGIVYARSSIEKVTDVAHVRNTILSHFLDSDADRLLMVDDDVRFPASGAMSLLESEHDFIGANYPRKHLGGGWASSPKLGGARLGSLVEADMLATGLLSLSRSAVERLSEGAELYETDEGRVQRAVMRTGPVAGRWVFEDQWLCSRWQSLGEVAWIDESVRCDHIGTMTFTKETA